MSSYIPPEHITTLTDLLKVLSDPKATQAALASLQERSDAGREVLERAQAVQKDADDKLKAHADESAALGRRSNELAAQEAGLTKRIAEWEEKFASFKVQVDTFVRETQEFDNKRTSFERNYAAFQKAKSALDSREAEFNLAFAALAEERKAFEAKKAKLLDWARAT